jgi:RNA polymerase sigma-70 factor (ECF subfamily)
MLPTTANGQPAFALYMRGWNHDRMDAGTTDFLPFHIQVLSLDGDRVKHVAAFFDTRLFEEFGLPPTLPADSVPPGAGSR